MNNKKLIISIINEYNFAPELCCSCENNKIWPNCIKSSDIEFREYNPYLPHSNTDIVECKSYHPISITSYERT